MLIACLEQFFRTIGCNIIDQDNSIVDIDIFLVLLC